MNVVAVIETAGYVCTNLASRLVIADTNKNSELIQMMVVY